VVEQLVISLSSSPVLQEHPVLRLGRAQRRTKTREKMCDVLLDCIGVGPRETWKQRGGIPWARQGKRPAHNRPTTVSPDQLAKPPQAHFRRSRSFQNDPRITSYKDTPGAGSRGEQANRDPDTIYTSRHSVLHERTESAAGGGKDPCYTKRYASCSC